MAVWDVLRAYGTLLAYLLASFLFLKFLLPFVLPFVLALFLANLIDPAVNWLEERWRVPRGVGAALVIAFLLASLAVGGVLALSRLGLELITLSRSLPSAYLEVADLAGRVADQVGRFSESLPPALKATLNRQLEGMYRMAQNLLAGGLGVLQGWFQALPGAGMVALVTAIATYLVSRDKALIRRFLLGLAPRGWRRGLVSIKDELLASTVGLVKAQAVLVLLTFVVILAGLTILGTPYALSASIGSALLDVIPVLGPALIFVPWAAYALLQGNVSMALALLLIYGSVSVVRAIAQAYVIGGRIGLHPLATLLALYLGVGVFGAAGFIYGPLVAIVLKAAVAAGLLPRGPLNTGGGIANG